MDKLMNAAGAISNERTEVKFTLPYKDTWRLTTDLLSGMLEPLGFGGQEDELMPERDDYVRAGEVSKSLRNFVIKYIDKIHPKFSIIDFTEYYMENDCERTTRTIIDLDNKHTKLSEVGDYTDTFEDNWSHEDHDVFTISNGYALVTKNKTKQYKEDWADLDRTIEVVIIKIDNNPYEGLTEIPRESTLLRDVTYTNVTIKRDIKFNNTELVASTPTYNYQSSNRPVAMDEGHLISEDKDSPMIEHTVEKSRGGGHKLKVYTDLENNLILTNPASGEIDILKVAGEVTVNSETPLECSGGIVIVKGEKGSKLTLISGEQQPCIGPWNRTNMSYGRWSPQGTSPKEIIIDTCTVVCESKVDGFSIGCYGTNDIPKITLLNGAELICPETKGKRVILKQAVPPVGSTKISEHMVYGIMKEGDSIFDVVSQEVKNAFSELITKYPMYKDALSTTTTVKDITESIKILSMNPNVDVTPLLKYDAKLFIKRCALLLRMPDFEEVVQLDEFRFDAMKKHEFINKLAYGGEEIEQGEAAANLINYLKLRTKNTPSWEFIKEVCYEIIPSYLYDFGKRRGSLVDQVDDFLEENKHLITKKIQDMIDPQSINYFLWDN